MAANRLGECYENGCGVAQDYKLVCWCVGPSQLLLNPLCPQDMLTLLHHCYLCLIDYITLIDAWHGMCHFRQEFYEVKKEIIDVNLIMIVIHCPLL